MSNGCNPELNRKQHQRATQKHYLVQLKRIVLFFPPIQQITVYLKRTFVHEIHRKEYEIK